MTFRRAARGSEVAWICLLATVLGPACSDGETLTELVVVVDTDYDVPGGLDEIALNVQGPSGMQYPVSTMLGAADSPSLPLYTFLEPAGAELGPILITATGRLAGTDLVERQVRTSFIRGESRTVYIMLLRGCAALDCADDMTCTETGCAAIDVPPLSLPLWTGSPTGPDAGADGGADVGADSGDACVASAEVCNGTDDDCDGVTDEDYDLTSDAQNCGACGTVCSDQDHASASCSAGACALTCDTGFQDCDTDYATGCEADLSAPATCGDCSTSCAVPTPLCDPAMGCVDDCAAGTALCGMACVNTATDLANCGSCGMACADPARSTPSCAGGSCDFSCDSGYDDCDRAAANGCEEQLNSDSHCGSCGTRCAPANATGDCGTGTCRVERCNSGFADCDSSPGNGCETAAMTVYRDEDGDGYGNPTTAMSAGCMIPSGWVDNSDDCDDDDARINPAAAEVCNQLDDNCAGGEDEGLSNCGERCLNPWVLDRPMMTFSHSNLCGTDSDDPPCDAGPDEDDHIYRLVLSDTATVRFTILGDGHEIIWIRRAFGGGGGCSFGPVEHCDSHEVTGMTTLSAGTYYVFIERDTSCSASVDVLFDIM